MKLKKMLRELYKREWIGELDFSELQGRKNQVKAALGLEKINYIVEFLDADFCIYYIDIFGQSGAEFIENTGMEEKCESGEAKYTRIEEVKK